MGVPQGFGGDDKATARLLEFYIAKGVRPSPCYLPFSSVGKLLR